MSNPFGVIKPKSLELPWTAVTTALVKQAGLHEGIWMPTFTFGRGATNLNFEGHLTPCAITPIVAVGLVRVEEMNELAVDAAEVNPQPRMLHVVGMGLPN